MAASQENAAMHRWGWLRKRRPSLLVDLCPDGEDDGNVASAHQGDAVLHPCFAVVVVVVTPQLVELLRHVAEVAGAVARLYLIVVSRFPAASPIPYQVVIISDSGSTIKGDLRSWEKGEKEGGGCYL